MLNFWDGKEPCWAIMGCSKFNYPFCPAYLRPEIPCWKQAYTQSERLLGIKRECSYCRVNRRYGILQL